MSQIRAVIDRFEGKMAVLIAEEDGERIILPARFLPDKCSEGDVVDITFAINKEASEKAKSEVQDLIDKLSGEAD
jgi:hypothetical protein